MNTINRYVCDTCCLISYFDSVFRTLGASTNISPKFRDIIDKTLNHFNSPLRISVPSVVFIEIFDKWLHDEETVKQFYYEVYYRIQESPNFEIKPLDKQVLEILASIEGGLANHDIFDKIVVASAIELDCPVLTIDKKIIRYMKSFRKLRQ
jgi:PIN domain nuclease of toxin-antitoxin system